MSNNIAKLIPELNFRKEENQYHFESDNGILKIQKEDLKWEIEDIDVDISSDISVSFTMKLKDYHNFKEQEMDLTKLFPRLKNQAITCQCEQYKLKLFEFAETNVSYGPNPKISGIATRAIIKNGNPINIRTNINVWDLFETKSLLQSNLEKFDIESSPHIYLKTLNPEKIDLNLKSPEEIESMDNLLIKEIQISDNLLEDSNFLFYKTKYENKHPTEIKDIENLIMFYDSNIIHFRMKIIENIETRNLEIRIDCKNTTNSTGKSIFDKKDTNFQKFINTSYSNYINAKNKMNIDFDLLLTYYVWIKNEKYPETKLLLCSEFMEIYKNTLNESKNESHKIFKRLQTFRFNQIKLKPVKLLKFLEPEIYDIIKQIKQININNNDYKQICDKFEETYIASIIQFNRNKIIHSGKLKIEKNDIDLIIKSWIYNFKKDLNVDDEIIKSIGESIKIELKNRIYLFDIKKQCEFMEYFIEIILLIILEANCELCHEKRFKTEVNEHISYNTQDYIKQFL